MSNFYELIVLPQAEVASATKLRQQLKLQPLRH